MKNILLAAFIGTTTLATTTAQEIGKTAPAFTTKDVTGKTISLSDFKGKTIVLEWFNFDCPFVVKHYSSGNMPKLQADAAKKDIIWLSINSSAEGKQGYFKPSKMAERAAKDGSKAAYILMDTDGKIGKNYDAKVTPHLYIIHKDGTLVYNGAIDSKATTESADVATAETLFANALTAVIAGKEVVNAVNKPYGCGVKY